MTSESITDNRVNYRADGDDLQFLLSRQRRMRSRSLHVQGQTELGMWRVVLAAELRRIRLTLGQARCLADVYAGSALEPSIGATLGLMYAGVFDAFRHARDRGGQISSYAAKHGIDEEKLLKLLLDLGPAADVALRDALDRWWAAGNQHDGGAASFRQVGMTIIDDDEE